MDRNSFVMYTKWMPVVKALDDKSRSDLFLAILQYQAGEELPPMTSTAEIAFLSMKSQFDVDREKYEKTIEKRRESGKLGGRPKANGFEEKAKKANGFSEKQTKAKKPDNDNVNDNDLKESTLKGTKEKFKPPSVDEVKQYAAEKGYAIDAEHFVDFYQSKGWMVGKNKMKDWKSAVRNWARSDKERQEKATKPNNNKFNNFQQRKYDFDDLERQLLKGG